MLITWIKFFQGVGLRSQVYRKQKGRESEDGRGKGIGE